MDSLTSNKTVMNFFVMNIDSIHLYFQTHVCVRTSHTETFRNCLDVNMNCLLYNVLPSFGMSTDRLPLLDDHWTPTISLGDTIICLDE